MSKRYRLSCSHSVTEQGPEQGLLTPTPCFTISVQPPKLITCTETYLNIPKEPIAKLMSTSGWMILNPPVFMTEVSP